MRYALATAFAFSLSASAALATGAMLTEGPASRTLETCRSWAQAQDEDAIYMWGQREAGDTVPEIARMRLTLTCMGDPQPEIAGFGSSAGFNESYCRKHRSAKICRQ